MKSTNLVFLTNVFKIREVFFFKFGRIGSTPGKEEIDCSLNYAG